MFDLSLPQLFCPVIIWMTLVGFFTSICLAVREGAMKLQKLHQIPCNRCAFSTRDYRLKCTVCPRQAFSEEAIGCREFEAVCSISLRERLKGFILSFLRCKKMRVDQTEVKRIR